MDFGEDYLKGEISTVLRGRVEKIYAMLTVMLIVITRRASRKLNYDRALSAARVEN
jgi:hypothetical protein